MNKGVLMISVEKNRIQVEVMEKMNEVKIHQQRTSINNKTSFLSKFLSPFDLLKKADAKKKVLICEDVRLMVLVMKSFLERQGYEVTTTESPVHFLNKKTLKEFDFIITDNHMPYMMGTQFIEYVEKELRLDIPIYIQSGDPDLKDQLSLSNVLRGIFYKGFGFESIMPEILSDFKRYQEEQKNKIEMKSAMMANAFIA